MLQDAPYFADSKIWDGDLPLERCDSDKLVSRANPTKTMPIPDSWKQRTKYPMSSHCDQVYMLYPFFNLASEKMIPFYELDRSCVLPFVEDFPVGIAACGKSRSTTHITTFPRATTVTAIRTLPSRDSSYNRGMLNQSIEKSRLGSPRLPCPITIILFVCWPLGTRITHGAFYLTGPKGISTSFGR